MELLRSYIDTTLFLSEVKRMLFQVQAKGNDEFVVLGDVITSQDEAREYLMQSVLRNWPFKFSVRSTDEHDLYAIFSLRFSHMDDDVYVYRSLFGDFRFTLNDDGITIRGVNLAFPCGGECVEAIGR
ncbi:hypothetical protein [Alicyclobacillus shizuokensis]|uniref:hypothetical protein n=1 Tax=Alicyclobacillus shizuokensis TaxID=392014 RepID=UPI00082EEACA|nr:hypothetical protein [Alicyclobacillus shizuokensis]